MSDVTGPVQRPQTAIPLSVKIAMAFIALFVLFALFGHALPPHGFRDASLFARLQRHVQPNILTIALVQFTVNLPLTVLLDTALSFLGLGVQPPLTSLGQIMSEGRDRLLTAWWLTLLPGAIIFCLALSVSMVGDWLRDRLDPTLRSES